MDKPWEEQRNRKYRDHDLTIEDLSDSAFNLIKSDAIKSFVETHESNQSRAIVAAFMGYLTSQGFRIVKKENT